jgi:hypothetical protein
VLNERAGRTTHTAVADEWDPRPSTDSWHPNQHSNPTAGGGYRDDDEDDRIYEKKYGYGNGGVSTNVQDVGGAIKDPDAAPGYTMATTEAYYAPPSGPPPGAVPSAAPSYYTHAPADHQPSMSGGGGGTHYNVGQTYGQ